MKFTHVHQSVRANNAECYLLLDQWTSSSLKTAAVPGILRVISFDRASVVRCARDASAVG